MSASDARRDSSRVGDLLASGSEIAGNAVGVALGFLVGDAPGAYVGAAAAPLVRDVLSRIGEEVQQRRLGPRETVRMGATLALAADEIRRRLEAGEHLRDDGFFDDELGRSAAEETIEAVLLAAQREPQESKIAHYAALLAYIAFSPGVDRHHGNFLVRTADDLSYRQLQLIASGKSSAAQSGMEVASENYEGVYADLDDLQRRRIATVSGIPAPGRREGTMLIYLTDLGAELYDGLALGRIGEANGIDVRDRRTAQ